jgi:hypothetical protein
MKNIETLKQKKKNDENIETLKQKEQHEEK